jgi:hypothetical protein
MPPAAPILTLPEIHATDSIALALTKNARAWYPHRRGAYDFKSLGHSPMTFLGQKTISSQPLVPRFLGTSVPGFSVPESPG